MAEDDEVLDSWNKQGKDPFMDSSNHVLDMAGETDHEPPLTLEEVEKRGESDSEEED